MPLIATPGAVDANSFVTRAEASLLLKFELQSAAWTEAEPETQDATLITATRKIVESVDWYGVPVTTTQALPWPMAGQGDRYGRVIASTVIPDDIKRATALWALALVQHQAYVQETSGLAAMQQIHVEDITITMRTPQPIAPEGHVPAFVRPLLALYGDVAGGATVRLVRT